MAEALFREVLKASKEKGKSEIIALTEHPWAGAIAFYKKMGFVECGRDKADVHLQYKIAL